jgi:hypothetical protein
MTSNLPPISVPAHVENAAAYIRAAQARIMSNRAKGARKIWIDECGESTVQRCVEFLSECGEFAPIDGRTHPLVSASLGDFRCKMIESEANWGRLTVNQTTAVLSMIDRAAKRIDDRAAARVEKAATAKHIGAVGERCDFGLRIVFVTSYETQYGTTFVHVMEDADGNVVVYKGSKPIGQKDDAIKIKATIKAHDRRDGIAQTIISRPKI